MSLTTGVLAGGRSIELDAGAWGVLVAALDPDLAGALPTAFAVPQDTVRAAGPDQDATDRLRAVGLADAAGAPTDTARTALGVLGAGRVRVEVRTWSGDRVVLAALGLQDALGVAAVRLERVTQVAAAGRPTVLEPAAGLELTLFDPADTVEVLWRTVPPAVADAVPPAAQDAAPAGGLAVAWPQALAPARFHDAPAPSPAAVRAGAAATRDPQAYWRAVVEATARDLLAAEHGWEQMPRVLADLAAGVTAVVEVTVVAQSDAGRGLQRGTWLLGRDRLVALRPGHRPQGPVLWLLDSSGEELRRDLTAALAAAVDAVDGVRTAPGGQRP